MEAKVLVVVKQLRVAKRLVSHVTRMYSTVLTMIFRASDCACLRQYGRLDQPNEREIKRQNAAITLLNCMIKESDWPESAICRSNSRVFPH
jgi:hypothetical protein